MTPNPEGGRHDYIIVKLPRLNWSIHYSAFIAVCCDNSYIDLRGGQSQKLLLENLTVQTNGNFVKETETSGYFVV